MQWFWNILCEIYTSLIDLGFEIRAPDFLFNIPEEHFSFKVKKRIYADSQFTEEERISILQAADDFYEFSNHWFEFEISFDLDNTDEEFIKEHHVLIRADSNHPLVLESDSSLVSNTLGLCYYRENFNISLYLVHERLKSHIAYKTTTLHELGHFLGLNHTLGKSIMNRYNSKNILYPTYIDAKEFVKHYKCKIESLKYFKLR